MAHYKMSDVVIEVKDKESSPSTSKYERFVGLEHYVSGDVEISQYGKTDSLESTMKVFQAGDILVARRNVYLRRASRVSFDGLTSGDSIVLRANDKVMARILPFVLNTDAFWNYADQHSDGTMSKRLSPKLLLDYEFDLPDEGLEDFSDLLWAVNDTRNSYRQLLIKTDDMVKSQFIEKFGDPVENEKEWPLVRLDELAEIKIGPFGSLLHKEDYIENGHALVNPSHIVDSKIVIDPKLTISDEKYDELSSYALRIGDVVLGRRGEMGRCAVVYEEGLVCGTGSMIIRPGTEMKPYFLQNIISSPAYRRVIEGKAVGVTMMNLNAPTVSSFMIPKLPVKLQEEYLEFVNQSDKSKFELNKAIEKTTNLMRDLMRQEFGK